MYYRQKKENKLSRLSFTNNGTLLQHENPFYFNREKRNFRSEHRKNIHITLKYSCPIVIGGAVKKNFPQFGSGFSKPHNTFENEKWTPQFVGPNKNLKSWNSFNKLQFVGASKLLDKKYFAKTSRSVSPANWFSTMANEKKGGIFVRWDWENKLQNEIYSSKQPRGCLFYQIFEKWGL